MKTKLLITIIGTVLVILALFGVFVHFYYSPAKEIKSFVIKHHDDDTIRIAFLGDSWAFFHKHHTCKMDSIIKSKTCQPVKVMSEGACGATSKLIYNRFEANGNIHRILKEGPDYCIIAAGVNDTHLKIGKLYYLANMKLILNFLIQNRIKPIILEIPNYDIYKIYNEINPLKKLLRHFSMVYTRSRMDCRDDYRQALRVMLQENFPSQSIILIKYDDWNSDAYNDIDSLYREDRIHLNDKGYNVLDSYISTQITSNYIQYESNL